MKIFNLHSFKYKTKKLLENDRNDIFTLTSNNQFLIIRKNNRILIFDLIRKITIKEIIMSFCFNQNHLNFKISKNNHFLLFCPYKDRYSNNILLHSVDLRYLKVNKLANKKTQTSTNYYKQLVNLKKNQQNFFWWYKTYKQIIEEEKIKCIKVKQSQGNFLKIKKT